MLAHEAFRIVCDEVDVNGSEDWLSCWLLFLLTPVTMPMIKQTKNRVEADAIISFFFFVEKRLFSLDMFVFWFLEMRMVRCVCLYVYKEVGCVMHY